MLFQYNIWAPICYFLYWGVCCIEGGRARNAPQKMGSRSPHRQMFGSQVVRLIKVKYKP